MRIFTNLKLHGDTPLRVQPGVGEWGPSQVMTTKRKRRVRWMWVIAFVLIATLLFFFGHYVYTIIMSAGD
ncbi:MAG: hypothetical protein FWF43_07740 [Propionibacteriaceae bacterium]|nr:hypothetical protein [Propionibacteriaceae bacterium]